MLGVCACGDIGGDISGDMEGEGDIGGEMGGEIMEVVSPFLRPALVLVLVEDIESFDLVCAKEILRRRAKTLDIATLGSEDLRSAEKV